MGNSTGVHKRAPHRRSTERRARSPGEINHFFGTGEAVENDAGDPDCVTSIIDTGLPVSSSSTHAHIILLLQHVRKSVHVLTPNPTPENRVQLF